MVKRGSRGGPARGVAVGARRAGQYQGWGDMRFRPGGGGLLPLLILPQSKGVCRSMVWVGLCVWGVCVCVSVFFFLLFFLVVLFSAAAKKARF